MNGIKYWLCLLGLSSWQMQATEGMWQQSQLAELITAMPASELAMRNTIKDFPAGAVVRIGQCSGSFVAAQGLVLTSRDCALSSLQAHSSLANNLLQQGYLAAGSLQELPVAPDVELLMPVAIDNVTRQINQELSPQLQGAARLEQLDETIANIVTECQTDSNIRCQVYSVQHGLAYQLVKQRLFRDIRLVYAPAQAIAEFGAEAALGSWPRYSANFAMFRVYVDKDGHGSSFHVDNQPYQPLSILQISNQGVQEHDWLFTVGFPQHSQRTALPLEVSQQSADWVRQHASLTQQIAIIRQFTNTNPELWIKYRPQLSRLESQHRQLAALLNPAGFAAALARQTELFQQLSSWLKADSARQARYASELQLLQQLLAQPTADSLSELTPTLASVQLLQAAVRLHQTAAQADLSAYSANVSQLKNSLKQMSQQFDLSVDSAMAVQWLAEYNQLPAAQRIAALDQWLGIDTNPNNLANSQTKLQQIFSRSSLNDQVERFALAGQSLAELQQNPDPLLQLGRLIAEAEHRIATAKLAHAGQLLLVRPKVAAALQAFNLAHGRAALTDANGSWRLGLGQVRGYQPSDAVWFTPISSIAGLLERQQVSVSPLLPVDLLAAVQQQSGKTSSDQANLAVNFLTDVDLPASSLGAPTLNAKGKLVGMLVDTVNERSQRPFLYNAVDDRAIHLDSRYLLWLLQQQPAAAHLLHELNLIAADQ